MPDPDRPFQPGDLPCSTGSPAAPRSAGPSAISAIAGVPTHEAAAVIRRLFDRPSVTGVFLDELAAALEECGFTPQYAVRFIRNTSTGASRAARRSGSASSPNIPFRPPRRSRSERSSTPRPPGTWAISAGHHYIA